MCRRSAASWRIHSWQRHYRRKGGGWSLRTIAGRRPPSGSNYSTKSYSIAARNSPTMRIGIDAHLASYQLRGMGKYVLQLVSGLEMADGRDEYVIYGDFRIFPQLRGCPHIEFRDPGGVAYPVWEQLVLPFWARQDRLDLLH